MDICRQYAPVVEKFSIDECFLDMSGTELIYPDLIETAYTIKNTIRDTLGFTVNVGVGSNKLLAKMASDFEKPDKVHTLFESEIQSKLWSLPVRDLLSVGRSTAARLESAGIRTIGELAKTDVRLLQKLIGSKFGKHLHDYANGIDNSPVSAEPAAAKGYGNSVTLEENVLNPEEAHNILLALADSVSSRMRADGAKAYCVSVSIRSYNFKNKSHQLKLPEPTDITTEIYETAKSLFDAMWDKRTPLRLLGISLSDIMREPYDQQSLFTDEKKERSRRLDKAVDSIRGRYGTDMIGRVSVLNSPVKVGKKHKKYPE